MVGVALLVFWHVQTHDDPNAGFVIASPVRVLQEFARLLGNGTLLEHLGATLAEIALGFGIGVGAATTLGYIIAHSRLLEHALGPYIVAFQAVPLIAIAPILFRILGPGLATNALICGLIVFFPMLVSTIVGIRGIAPEHRDLLRAMSATRWQMFTQLELPSALPVLFGGIKISSTLAVAGAVVAEGFSATSGLGFLIYSSRYAYNTAGILVGIFTLTLLALALYETAQRLEARLLHWRRKR
jgi:NitT/TauT family transport system permease protein